MTFSQSLAFPLAIGLMTACDPGGDATPVDGGGTTSATTSANHSSATGGASSPKDKSSTGGASSTQDKSSTGGTKVTVTGPAVSATLTISGAERKPVSPRFFGQNYWSWVPSWGDAVASVETQTQELKLRFLRAGGANNDKQEPSPFTLAEVDDFVTFARSVGAEPLLQVPLIKSIAGAAATAQDAADLVTYVNVTKSYGIKYFSIGNEPDLYEEQSLRDAGYDAVAFCTEYREFATAMRAVDPSIKLVGPDLSWKYGAENDWLTPFLENCGDVVDVVAVHRYPLQPTACTEAKAYSDVVAYRRVLTRLRKVMDSTGQTGKPLAFTEANITWDGDPAKSTMEASPGSFSAALWLADNIGASLEGQLDSVNYWSLSEGWTLGFFDGTKPRPAFHVMKLFSTQFGSEVLTVTGASTDLSAYAGHDTDLARTSLFFINKTASPLELSVTFADLPRTGTIALVVAPKSLQLASVPDDGGTVTVTNYGSDMTSPTVAAP